MQTPSIDQAIDQAVRHQAGGSLQEAEQLYRAVLAVEPRHPEANHNLGTLLLELNRMQDALKYLKTALEADPRDGQLWVSYIDALIHAGKYSEARALLDLGQRRGLPPEMIHSLRRRIDTLEPDPFLTAAPGDWDAAAPASPDPVGQPSPQEQDEILKLASAGRYGRAESLARGLTSRFRNHVWGWKTLAYLLRLQGRFDEALQAIRTAVQLAPDDPKVHFELGLAFDRLGHVGEAEASMRRALQLNPQFAEVHNELGMILERTDRASEAETSYRRALALRPDWPGVLSNLAIALKFQGKLDEAETSLRRAIALEPDGGGAYVNLASILRDTNRLAEAEQSLRRVVERYPLMTEARSNLLFSLNYSAEHSPQYCLEEARRYGEVVRSKVKTPYSSWTCANDPIRLRIGIISGDIHSHPVGFFLESVLSHLDQSKVEVIGYPTNPRMDALTQRVQPYFSGWRQLNAYSDEAAAQEIHRDGIHILVELSGHTANNRLPVLAWKPAPIQVSWLGYFATTGVKEIDYFLADEVSVPPAHQSHFTESIWYLPDTRLCFTPPDSDVPIYPLPALWNGSITFGSFQNLAKLNDKTLSLWGRVLEAVPDARLRIQSPQLSSPAMQAQLTERLKSVGIAAERTSMHGHAARPLYLAAHAEVDIILDTMPFPGGTTTCEALWMGVPTLTIAGDRLISRQGASLMHAAGLPEWVADDENMFVSKAVAFCRERGKLSELRAGLRAQLRSTPLFDARRFAANLESALWQMWQEWRQRR